jgi:hypothetical protein
MLQRVWQELDYRINICCVTKGGHIEYLQGGTETWSVSPSVVHALLRRDYPGFCTGEVGNLGGTYELPYTYEMLVKMDCRKVSYCYNFG